MSNDMFNPRRIMVTGGAGFIGNNFVRILLDEHERIIVHNVDMLTYAGSTENVSDLDAAYPGRHVFYRADIGDREAMESIFASAKPDAVVNFAAETHVDRSIDDPLGFVKTNVLGTATLLDIARKFWGKTANRRFHHVSTDEVYGSLGPEGKFHESTAYDPSSPYSASKAASDHLVRAWHRTYGFPVTVTNCSNNYGPRQFPEKLIPLMIAKALEGKALPVYGRGDNVRDWLHVEDHCRAIWTVMRRGRIGETYNVGADNEWTNLDLVKLLCSRLDRIRPRKSGRYSDLISFVQDRPGHDARYAVDSERIRGELGWRPRHTFESGLDDTIKWYLAHDDWVRSATSSSYAGERLGVLEPPHSPR